MNRPIAPNIPSDYEVLERRPARDAGGNIVGSKYDPTREDRPDRWASDHALAYDPVQASADRVAERVLGELRPLLEEIAAAVRAHEKA